MQNGIEYPPLVDSVSAHQNGLLDAVHNKISLHDVLLAAEEHVMAVSYCRGYKMACDIIKLENRSG